MVSLTGHPVRCHNICTFQCFGATLIQILHGCVFNCRKGHIEQVEDCVGPILQMPLYPEKEWVISLSSPEVLILQAIAIPQAQQYKMLCVYFFW